MDFLKKTSKNILSGMGHLQKYAKSILTSQTTYAFEDTPQPTKEWANKAIPVPVDYKSAIDKAHNLYSKDLTPGVLPAVMMMESSMGTDRRNEKYDLGASGWLTGLTKTGHAAEILKNKNNTSYEVFKKDKSGKPYFTGVEDVSTPEGALGLTASAWAVLKRNNPQLSDEDIYFQLYNANKEVDTPNRRQAFRDYLEQYK